MSPKKEILFIIYTHMNMRKKTENKCNFLFVHHLFLSNPSPLPVREYRSRFTSEETVSFCLRVMVGVIILYDYVHPVGAFAKSSKIDVSTVMLAP